MERRTFLAMVPGGLLAAPLAAEAQPAAKIARIGYLTAADLASAGDRVMERRAFTPRWTG